MRRKSKNAWRNLPVGTSVLVRDTAADVLGQPARDDGVAASGMVYQGRIHFFRDGLADRAAVARTLWHELLHYGLRRFLRKGEYIAKLNQLYADDAWISAHADAWLATQEGRDTARAHGNAYAMACGVDEVLAALAEYCQGQYRTNGQVAKAIPTVASGVAKLARTFGITEAASRWQRDINDEGRELVRSIFRRLREVAPATSSDWARATDPAFMARAREIESETDRIERSAEELPWEVRRDASRPSKSEHVEAFLPGSIASMKVSLASLPSTAPAGLCRNTRKSPAARPMCCGRSMRPTFPWRSPGRRWTMCSRTSIATR